ncbi:MAG: ABC transporter substrate-binding protein, partial [Geminicoccaceae bacterium]
MNVPKLVGGLAGFALALLSGTAFAASGPIKIGVIAEAQAIAGASIPQAAQLAAEDINAKGGIDGRQVQIITYDNHS